MPLLLFVECGYFLLNPNNLGLEPSDYFWDLRNIFEVPYLRIGDGLHVSAENYCEPKKYNQIIKMKGNKNADDMRSRSSNDRICSKTDSLAEFDIILSKIMIAYCCCFEFAAL